MQQEAKEREDRHTALARKSRAKKRATGEPDTSGESPGQSSTPSKKPRIEGDDGSTNKLASEKDSTSQQGSVAPEPADNVSPTSSDDLKNPGASKRKAYTPLRTQYSLRETVIPIQPLSLEQHGKNESPSKITRRISSTEDNEDPLLPSSSDNKSTPKPKSQARGAKKHKQEVVSSKKKRAPTGKQSKKVDEEVSVPTASVSAAAAAVPVSSPDPIFLTPPLDSTSKVANVLSTVMTTQVVQPTPPYTPAHVSTTEDHKTQSQSVTSSPNDTSTDNLSLTSESKGTPSSCHTKSPPSDSKSITLTCFNVDILNNEDDKSASPAVVTIDPNAIAHSPVNNGEPTSSITECDPDEMRPFVELTKKTASIISNKTSPKRPSLLPFRRRSLSATTASQVTTKQSVAGRGRRKSEGGRNIQVCEYGNEVVVHFSFACSDKEETAGRKHKDTT